MRFLTLNKSCFSTLADTANFRIPLKDPYTGKLLDQNLNRYDQIFSAYLYKRKITKDQISPKIHIVEHKTEEQQNHFKYQSLQPLKVGMDQQIMQKLIKEDPSNINSNYVISIFCQNNFKQMMDEYLQKVLVCGKAPKNYELQEQVEQQVKDLTKVYYYGEQITPLQRQIQLKYLSLKQLKNIRYENVLRNGEKNAFNRCVWRQENQRILQDLVNWHQSDFNTDDINYRPFFEPLNLLTRLQPVKKLYSLMGTGTILDRISFRSQIKPYYQRTSAYYEFVALKIYHRIEHWVNSIQFTNLLKIPHDYLIQQSVRQIHAWLIVGRLQKIDTSSSRYVANILKLMIRKDMQKLCQTKTVRKSQILVKNINQMIMNNSQYLQMHFRLSNITKDNHYKGIDALVWTIAFAEKVQRYNDIVYLFGEYLVKNFQMIEQYSEQDLMNGLIQFDVYVADPNYKKIMLEVNPQMSKQQFQAQFDSDRLDKKYYYSYVQKGVKLPIQYLKQKSQKYQIAFSELVLRPIAKFFTKYSSLELMDYFDEMDKQKKQNREKNKTSNWKTEADTLKQVKKQYKQLDRIRLKRKNYSNISTKDTK